MSKSHDDDKKDQKDEMPDQKPKERAYRALIKEKVPKVPVSTPDVNKEKEKEKEKSSEEESQAFGTTRFDTARVPDASKSKSTSNSNASKSSSSPGSGSANFDYREPEEWERNLLSLKNPRIVRTDALKVKSGQPLIPKPHMKEIESLMHSEINKTNQINKTNKDFNKLKNDILVLMQNYLATPEATKLGGDIIWSMREIEKLKIDGTDDDARTKLIQLTGKLAILKEHASASTSTKEGRWFPFKRKNKLKDSLDGIDKKLNGSEIYQRLIVKPGIKINADSQDSERRGEGSKK